MKKEKQTFIKINKMKTDVQKNPIQNRIRIKIYFFQIQIFKIETKKNLKKFSKKCFGASPMGVYEKRTLPFSLPFAYFTALSLHRFTTRKGVRIV